MQPGLRRSNKQDAEVYKDQTCHAQETRAGCHHVTPVTPRGLCPHPQLRLFLCYLVSSICWSGVPFSMPLVRKLKSIPKTGPVQVQLDFTSIQARYCLIPQGYILGFVVCVSEVLAREPRLIDPVNFVFQRRKFNSALKRQHNI